MVYEIKQITEREAMELLRSGEHTGHYTPLGLFWHVSSGQDFDGVEQTVYVGIDNSDGQAFTEDFDDVSACLAWLRGENKQDEKEAKV